MAERMVILFAWFVGRVTRLFDPLATPAGACRPRPNSAPRRARANTRVGPISPQTRNNQPSVEPVIHRVVSQRYHLDMIRFILIQVTARPPDRHQLISEHTSLPPHTRLTSSPLAYPPSPQNRQGKTRLSKWSVSSSFVIRIFKPGPSSGTITLTGALIRAQVCSV